MMLDLGVVLGDQKIEQQTSECFCKDTWRKPVMEGNGLPEEISQNCCLCHITWMYIGSANRFILSTLWWLHSGQSWWCVSQDNAFILDVPLSSSPRPPLILYEQVSRRYPQTVSTRKMLLQLLPSKATLRWAAEWQIPMFVFCPHTKLKLSWTKLNLALPSLFISDQSGSHGGSRVCVLAERLM